MEAVQVKFDNFKKFLGEQAPDAMMLMLFMSAPLDKFLWTIHLKDKEEIQVSEITDKVLGYAGLSRARFDLATITKFELYVEYFRDMSRKLFAKQ